jgi:large subunit ribosomal protein L19
MKKTENIINPFKKEKIPDIRAGDTVKVFLKIKEKDKQRIQVFEGIVIAKKHSKEIGATITVRKVVANVGVERIFPLHLPSIDKIEVVKRSKVRRAKLYYLRKAKGKRARLKRKDLKKRKDEKVKENIEEQKKTEDELPAQEETQTEKEAKTELDTEVKSKEEEKTKNSEIIEKENKKTPEPEKS